MASLFSEFSDTYEEFREKFPNHPLNDELRNRIVRGRFPTNQWLKDRTRRMKDLMEPMWLRSGGSRHHGNTVN